MGVVKEIYPFKSHFLTLQGLKYHYLDEGEGDTVVMLHGNPTWSYYYRNLIHTLKDNYRTIVPDHMGCGFSDKPDDTSYTYSLEQRVSDLEQLLESLAIKEKITLVVHDWGGMIGMTYATRYPERISRLIILNTGAFHLPKTKKFPLALRLGRDSIIGTFLIRGLNAFSLAASYAGFKKPVSNNVRKAYRAPYDSWKNRIATLRFVQDIPLQPGDRGYDIINNVQENLHQFRAIPMTIFWGEKDFVFDLHFLEEWKKRFPEAEVHQYPNCGHYILEDAKKEIIPLIKQFLVANPI